MKDSLRVLVLNRCFPPEVGATGNIAEDFGRILSRSHTVTFLVGRPVEMERADSDYLTKRDVQNGFALERLWSTTFSHRRMLGRLANYVSYLFVALFRSLTIQPRPDVILAMTDPPLTCVIGAVVSIVRKCKFVYHIQDVHPDMALASGLINPGWAVSLWERLHRWALRQGDLLIVLGEDMKERMLAKGIRSSSIVVVCNGANRLEPITQTEHPTVKAIRGNYPFIVMHAGNLGYAGSWDAFVEAVHSLKDANVGVVFVGEGTRRSFLESLTKELPYVRFFPYFPESDLPFVLAAGDIQVVSIKRGLEGLVVPSKLYSILMCGRPVLAVAPESSAICRLVDDHSCGLKADPDDPQAICDQLLFARDHPEELKNMASRSRKLGLQCDRRILGEDFVHAIESVV